MADVRVVAVAGGFDPLHPGHISHLREARKLGTRLVVILNPDQDLIRKKGMVFMLYEARKSILEELRCVDQVIMAIDGDGTVAQTLRELRPHIFAKGGDRVPGNMPANEIAVCQEIGCEVIFGVGGSKEYSSTELIRSAIRRAVSK